MSTQRREAKGPFTDELPYGVFSLPGQAPRVGVAIGERVLDLRAVLASGEVNPDDFAQPSLNAFMAHGPQAWASTRRELQRLLSDPEVLEPHLIPLSAVRLQLPIEVADYVDFYASEHHAGNVGRMFRPDGDPLTPNWRHMPIGYHGRAGTVVVTGSDIVRPLGQISPGGSGGSPRGLTRAGRAEADVRSQPQAGHRGRARAGSWGSGRPAAYRCPWRTSPSTCSGSSS